MVLGSFTEGEAQFFWTIKGFKAPIVQLSMHTGCSEVIHTRGAFQHSQLAEQSSLPPFYDGGRLIILR